VRLLILDEPTSSLNEADSKMLLDLLLEFKKQGMTSIIISHKLNEIAYVADKITVVRDGSTIETIDNSSRTVDEDRIIRGMVGRELSDRYPAREHNVSDQVVMEVRNWTVHHPIYSEKVVDDHVNFTVHKGEIVGFSGLQGAGRTELAMSIFGHSYGAGISGTLILNGREVTLKTERQAIEAGLAYVTEDRKGNGLVLEQTIAKNTTMARLEKVCSRGIVNVDQENAVAEEYKEKLKTKTPSVQQAVGNLSGGNQQKVLLAKWMFADPDVLILDEPTRGIDVGAKYEIYCIMNDLVAQGKSVIMISSEMPELLGMCDRIYVMNEGRMVAEMPAAEASQEKIMAAILKSDKN
jgi:putative multiple sugar transport system ATP-binding protein